MQGTPTQSPNQPPPASTDQVRLDRWLWAARFFKTRSLAKAAIEGGKVHLSGKRTKPAKEIRAGDTLTIRRGMVEQTILVEQLADKRGSATVAATLYSETPQSIEQREQLRAQRSMERAGLKIPSQKPSKKQRRDLRKLKTAPEQAEDSL